MQKKNVVSMWLRDGGETVEIAAYNKHTDMSEAIGLRHICMFVNKA